MRREISHCLRTPTGQIWQVGGKSPTKPHAAAKSAPTRLPQRERPHATNAAGLCMHGTNCPWTLDAHLVSPMRMTVLHVSQPESQLLVPSLKTFRARRKPPGEEGGGGRHPKRKMDFVSTSHVRCRQGRAPHVVKRADGLTLLNEIAKGSHTRCRSFGHNPDRSWWERSNHRGLE